MRVFRVTGAFVVLAAALVLSASAAADPAGWKRCSSASHGFSLAYPGGWHVASYSRLHVLSPGAAHRREFLRQVACLHYDPKPFTVYEATEGPATAVSVYRIEGARSYQRETRAFFRNGYTRTISKANVRVAGRAAIRFQIYLRPGAPLVDRSYVYGYMIDCGKRGGVLLEAWRYGYQPVSTAQYRANKAVLDRMAPTLLVP